MPYTSATLADFEDLGLHDMSNVHPAKREDVGRVRMGYAAKYPVPGEGRTIWRAVAKLRSTEDRTRSHGVNLPEWPGRYSRFVLINADDRGGDGHRAVQASRRDVVTGESAIVRSLHVLTAKHEGLHPITKLGHRVKPVQRGLDELFSQEFGLPYDPFDAGPVQKALMAAAVSRYGSTSDGEMKTEALMEWNDLGDGARQIPRLIGQVYDRYLSSASPASEGIYRFVALNPFDHRPQDESVPVDLQMQRFYVPESVLSSVRRAHNGPSAPKLTPFLPVDWGTPSIAVDELAAQPRGGDLEAALAAHGFTAQFGPFRPFMEPRSDLVRSWNLTDEEVVFLVSRRDHAFDQLRDDIHASAKRFPELLEERDPGEWSAAARKEFREISTTQAKRLTAIHREAPNPLGVLQELQTIFRG